MQRVGSDPTSSGTASIVTRSEMAQPATHLHGEQVGGVRDSSTTEFQGRSYHLGDTLLWSALSPGSPTPVRRRSMPFGAGITDLKSDQSVDSVTARSVPDTSRSRLLEVSEVLGVCIARGRNGSVGDTLVQQCSSPSPIPAFPDPPRTKQCGGDSPRQNDQRKTSPSEAQRLSRPLIPRSYSTPATFILVKFCLAGQILSHLTPLV